MQDKNKKRTRRKYDDDFKSEVLRMIASGRSVLDVSQSLGVGENLVYKWRNQQSSSIPKVPSSEADLRSENDRLKAALRQAEQERDILKKALNIFSRET